MIDVTVDGQARQEMHVDGGAFAQAFLYPAALGERRRERARRGAATPEAEAYIIRNARLDPDWAAVERRTLGIAGRAIATMIATSGYNDVLRMWSNTQRDGIGYNLAFIGRDFTEELPSPFDQAYMRALFDYGFERGRRGYRLGAPAAPVTKAGRPEASARLRHPPPREGRPLHAWRRGAAAAGVRAAAGDDRVPAHRQGRGPRPRHPGGGRRAAVR